MLLIDDISNDKEKTIKGLRKRGFKNIGVIDEIIDLNNNRKKIQQELDQILFESNTISKEIAEIFKTGNQVKSIDKLKTKSTDLKAKSKFQFL